MKKILCAALITILLFAGVAGALAENGINGKDEQTICISYTVAGNYEISIPMSGISGQSGRSGIRPKKGNDVTLSDGETFGSFDVEVNNVLLQKDTMLRVTVLSENHFSMILPNGSAVPYDLIGADEDGTVMLIHAGETSGSKTLSINLGNTDGLNYAGTYYDKLTFECEVLPESGTQTE